MAGVFDRLSEEAVVKALQELPTPCYVLDEKVLKENGEILSEVQEHTGCRILLAQKAFSNYDLYPALAPYLAGTEASGLFEARLGREEMPDKEVHVFSTAYKARDMEALFNYADHIVFNSIGQLAVFGPAAKSSGMSLGLRINPECSTQEESHSIYDPCATGSRLGVTRAQWDKLMTPDVYALLDGLHFHTLCEQDAYDLETTLVAVEEKFGQFLPDMKWLNMGGGHHITRKGYDIPRLEKLIKTYTDKYDLQVYLEPGEACALNAGYLITTVLDVTENNNVTNVIIDASAACHMPDVIEMPYRPPLYGAGEAGEKAFPVRLGGPSCLAGDVIGNYTFDQMPRIGDRLIFGDMAIYTTCKNNTFNGMPLPDVHVLHPDNTVTTVARFGYQDFKYRLGSS
ncbi:MAG: carboxynorspermidine decarboxylase [Lachnospiraceae bacterium]|jgi:carboxynorspermidine decarboxylase|nr:carboxynorspermidine decarboxylase [Lachnospiraceae bacterium]